MTSWLCLALIVSACLLKSSPGLTRRPEYGVIGYGIDFWQPVCAFACRTTIAFMAVHCNQTIGYGNELENHEDASSPTPECFATNDPFLQTLAWCISTHCDNIAIPRLERYWMLKVPGEWTHQPSPKWSYKESLNSITKLPMSDVSMGEPLSEASLVKEEEYISNFNAMSSWASVEVTHETYG